MEFGASENAEEATVHTCSTCMMAKIPMHGPYVMSTWHSGVIEWHVHQRLVPSSRNTEKLT